MGFLCWTPKYISLNCKRSAPNQARFLLAEVTYMGFSRRHILFSSCTWIQGDIYTTVFLTPFVFLKIDVLISDVETEHIYTVIPSLMRFGKCTQIQYCSEKTISVVGGQKLVFKMILTVPVLISAFSYVIAFFKHFRATFCWWLTGQSLRCAD